MTGIAFAVALVAVALIASHFLHSYLKLRERERLSSTDKAELDAKFAEFEKWKGSVVQFMANARR